MSVQLTTALLTLVAGVQTPATISTGCDTIPACIAHVRQVADPSDGITDSENDVAQRLQSFGPHAITPVMELLDDPDPNVRELAGYILRNMPGLEPRHLGRLQQAVEAGDGWLPPAIASIGTPEAIRFLVSELRKNPEAHTQLTYAFRRLGPTSLPYLLELFQCGQSCDEDLLYVAGRIFAEMCAKAFDVVEPLERIATERGASLVARRFALRALAGLRETAHPAVPALLELTRLESAAVQDEARQALLAIGGPGTREVLEASLDAENPLFALRDIAQLGDRGREAGARVEKLLGSSGRDTRVAAARSLGFIGHRASAPRLAAALGDPDDWRLAYVAAEALGQLRAAEARGALQATASSHWYPPVREAARTALRALDGTHHYPSVTERLNFALDFLSYEHAGRSYPACADRDRFPPIPALSETLDPARQPSLAERLAYDREIGFFDEGALQTTRERTVPQVGVRIKGGWLVGNHGGEWGGALVFRSDAGDATTLLRTNVSAIHVMRNRRIVAVAGLAHLTTNTGSVYRISCTPARCAARWWKELPGAPRSSWLIATGELLINTNGGSVLLTSSGTLTMAGCHSDSKR